MEKGTFRLVMAALVLVPSLALGAIWAHPGSRKTISTFFAPLPAPTHDAGKVSLPALATTFGAESAELRSLREDASLGAPGNQADAPVRARGALFVLDPRGAPIAPQGRSPRPSRLERPEIVLREDPAFDAAVEHLRQVPEARDRFVAALKRSSRFSVDLARIARAWKVPAALVAVAFVESAFEPSIRPSSDGAVGMWQLTPDVAHVYGLSMLLSYDERRGLTSGTEAAMRYLADLRERFGSWELALAAYSMGYARASDTVAKLGSTDYEVLAPSLPRGATTYVAEVMGVAMVLGNLERYGLDTVKLAEPVSLSELEVPAGTSLSAVARAASVSPAFLKELNPEYDSDLVPTSTFPMMVHVPAETLARARAVLPLLRSTGDSPDLDGGAARDEQDADKKPEPPSRVVSKGTDSRIFYRVREGDTLASLSREYGVSLETLASDNALDPTSSLRAGTILSIRLPSSPSGSSSSSSSSRSSSDGPRAPSHAPPIAPAHPRTPGKHP